MSKCDYCSSAINDADVKCGNCGAPVSAEGTAAPDFRTCPFCGRKLLALASPACSYCGRRLPENYIKAREADLKRLSEIKEGGESSEVSSKIDEFIRQSARSSHPSSGLGLLDITSLTDLLS